MWPWEHAAVAYLCYSVLTRLWSERGPDAAPVVALLFASQLPDVIDKPLAWWLHLLPSGRSLGHSVFFALPLAACALWLGWLRRRTAVGVAFAVGYLSHLPGDVVYPVLLGDEATTGFLLYPLVPRTDSAGPGVLGKIVEYTGDFLAFLQTPRGLLYLGGETLLLLVTLWFWVWDGKPGLGAFTSRLRRAVSG